MRKKGVPISLTLPRESYAQLETLRGVLHISQSATIAQALARWFNNEPLVGGSNGAEKEDEDGSDAIGVHDHQRSEG